MMVWLRRNLFRSPADGVVTLVAGSLAIYLIYQAAQFVFVTGRWEIIEVNLKLLLVGRFPEEQMWVLGASVLAIAFWAGLVARSLRRQAPAKQNPLRMILELAGRFGLVFLLAVLLILLSGDSSNWLLAGGVVVAILLGRLVGSVRERVSLLRRLPRLLWVLPWTLLPLAFIYYTLSLSALEEWGGFLINFYIAILAIALCFPLGVLLALGRRSSFPIVRLITTTYIELIRGAPLFVLLLLAGVALEFFVPPDLAPDQIFRAVTVFTLFTAAYLAEIVRGGLQSIPKGQTEAGKALGLSTLKVTFLITLPQALRNVIPAQIGQFISLFKDTTLAGAALSVLEILNIGTAITKQDDFLGQGLIYESLAFVGFLFWVGSYVMSRESQRLEKRLGVGLR
jgi:general L-amino acid transport system permease protein